MALDPDYIEQCDQIRGAFDRNRAWAEREEKKLDQEYEAKRNLVYREHQRLDSLLPNVEEFVESHPSDGEKARRECVKELLENGWYLCDDPRRMPSNTWFILIEGKGFPKSFLMSSERVQPEVPRVAKKLAKNFGFQVLVRFNRIYCGPN
jgi:hypothetical protein